MLASNLLHINSIIKTVTKSHGVLGFWGFGVLGAEEDKGAALYLILDG